MKDDQVYLVHIIECCERILRYTGDGRAAFLESTMAQDAVIRNFEVIGEAVKCLSQTFRDTHSHVDWRRIAGLRDVLIHDYMGVDLEEVWLITTESYRI